MLISLSGLPGTGKSTVAKLAAAELAADLRIDSIEQPMFTAGFAVEGVGYEVAQAVAVDNLSIGLTVIADCVNPWPLTRDAWREPLGVPAFACSKSSLCAAMWMNTAVPPRSW